MTIENLRAVAENMPFNKLIGLRVARLHADGVTLECGMRDELKNIAGVMHGGANLTTGGQSRLGRAAFVQTLR